MVVADCSDIWEVSREQCCRCARHVAERYKHSNMISRSFEIVRDLVVRSLSFSESKPMIPISCLLPHRNELAGSHGKWRTVNVAIIFKKYIVNPFYGSCYECILTKPVLYYIKDGNYIYVNVYGGFWTQYAQSNMPSIRRSNVDQSAVNCCDIHPMELQEMFKIFITYMRLKIIKLILQPHFQGPMR